MRNKFRWFYAHTIEMALVVICVLLFLSNYLLNPQRPHVVAPEGYYGHTDVKQHYIQALEMRNAGRITTYMYGPLYGFFGGLFLNIYPTDIFLIPNIMLFCATIIGFFLLMKRMFGVAIALTTVLITMTSYTILKLFVFPWATSITACCTVWIFYIISLLQKRTISMRERFTLIVLAAVVAAAAYYARFSIEFITVCFPLFIYFAWEVYRTRRWWPTAREGMIFTGIVLMLLAPLLYDHYLRYGHPFKTQYSYIELRPGVPYQSLEALEPAKIFRSIGEVVFGIGYTDELYKPVLYESPVLVLQLIGIVVTVYFWSRFSHETRMILIGCFAVIFFNMFFYGSYPAFVGDTVKYGSVHYVRVSLILLNIFLAASIWGYLQQRLVSTPKVRKKNSME